MPKISQKIESKSNFKLFENFPRQKNFRILKFLTQNVILYVPRMFLSDVGWYTAANICSVYITCVHTKLVKPLCIHVCGRTNRNYMYIVCRMWEVENEIDFLVVLYFCFIKRHVETVTFFPKLPFFWKMVKNNLFLHTTYVSSI